ncbi:hypothetical protein ACK1CN_20900 [Vibrio coralliilyticus]|uniref:hypothetical protein n=1 Tax=Vibrio TaxID=662 RepID=UPI00156177A7|nr:MULTISPECIES: hypothetical protein [Vibrio]NRF16363.1 hypothetical protein [Vibrio coralliilyticus]QXL80322.1 hypothetical protein [Vibrio sp.]
MSDRYPLQTTLQGALKRDFMTFKQREHLSDAESARQLLALGLRIELSDASEPAVSHRCLLEEVYRTQRLTSAMVDLVFGQTFNRAHLTAQRTASSALRQQVKADIEQQIATYLSGKPSAD